MTAHDGQCFAIVSLPTQLMLEIYDSLQKVLVCRNLHQLCRIADTIIQACVESVLRCQRPAFSDACRIFRLRCSCSISAANFARFQMHRSRDRTFFFSSGHGTAIAGNLALENIVRTEDDAIRKSFTAEIKRLYTSSFNQFSKCYYVQKLYKSRISLNRVQHTSYVLFTE